MDYTYIAYDNRKKLINGSIAALSENVASERLVKQGYKILYLKPASVLKTDLSRYLSTKKAVKTDQVVLFARQVATLLNAGVNLVMALELLHTQAENSTFKDVLANVILDVRTGHKLSESMGKYPAVFPSLFCRSLSVGEQSGEMGRVLNQAADHMEKNINAKKGVKGALAYPAFMMGVAIVVVFVLINFVFPTFIGLYGTLGANIPPATRSLLSIVNFIRVVFPYFIGVVVVAAVAILIYTRTPSGKYNWDKLLLKVPILGKIILLRELTGNCRTMSMLFRSGLSLSDILQVLVESSSNMVVVDAWSNVKTAVFKGEGLSGPMARNPVFLPMMVEMVRVGEETGEMDSTLLAVAQNYDAEADGRTKTFIGIIQPAMTIIIGGIVFVIVLAMMSLMYSIYGQIKT